MEDFSLCRTCLRQCSLNPIFVECMDHTEYLNAIFVTTGLKIGVRDGLPQKMCTDCVEFVSKSLKFRKKCKDSETYLYNMKKQLVNKILLQSEGSAVTCEKETEDIDEDDRPLKHFVDKQCSFQDFESNNDITKETQNKVENAIIDNSKEIPSQDNSLVENVSEVLLYEVLDVDKKRVMCKLCGKQLSLRSVGGHVSRAHPAADTRAACALCGARVTHSKLNRHMLLVHGDGTFKCIHCKVEHESREQLVAHAPTCAHKKKKRKPSEASRQLSQCATCCAWLRASSVRAHALRHAGLAPVCEHCGLRLSNKLRLLEHARAKHGLDKLRCRYCDFRSAGLPAMRNHERRHLGERPFVCECCGARFHAAALLAQHRHSHRTDRRVQCPQCPATFKSPSSLHSHRRSTHTHTVYRCGACGRGYRARHYAVRHLRTVHRYKGSEPPVTVETVPAVTEE